MLPITDDDPILQLGMHPITDDVERAGLFCVAVPNPLTGQFPLDHADLRLTSLADVPLETLLGTVQERV